MSQAKAGQGASVRPGEIEAAQDRSRKTRDKLVKAFGKLLREKDFESITMAELAKRAGVAVGTVYRRFENKNALIPIIFEVYMQMLQETSAQGGAQLALTEDDTLWTATWRMCEAASKMLAGEPQLIRTAHLYARLRPDLVGEDWNGIIETSVGQFRQVIDHFADEVQRPDPDAAARMMFYLLNTVMVEQGLYGDAGPGAALRLESEAFIEECATTIFGYLTVGEA